MSAHMSDSPTTAMRMLSPSTPYLDTNQTNDAKQKSASGLRCVGIHVPIVIKRTVDKHIVTSYLPLAWNGSIRNDRIVHSSPKTSWMYGTRKIALEC